MSLDINASRNVVGELANKLKINLLEAAEGILTILNANMAMQSGHAQYSVE